MKTICVYCGSVHGFHPRYQEAAESLGRTLAEKEITLVYGGARVGLMGTVADAALAAGGTVIGIIPRFMDGPITKLNHQELVHRGLTQLYMVDSMHTRKQKMAELSEGFIALPGGFGTLDEMFEMLTWAQLELHQKPCGFLNVDGYYDALETFLDHMETEGFLHTHHRKLPFFEPEIPVLLEKMGA